MLERTAVPPVEIRAVTPRVTFRDVALNALVAIAYWMLAELMLLAVTPAGSRVTAIWPSAGVAVAACLLGGTRLLPGIAAGALATAVLHLPLIPAVGIAGGVLVEPLIDLKLLRRLGFDERLERVRDPLLLAGVSFVGAFVSVGFGTLVASLAGVISPANAMSVFVVWWFRNALGVQIVVSLVLAWVRSRPIDWTWRRTIEAAGVAVMMLALSQLVFGLWSIHGQNIPMGFTFFPLVGYAGLRFGPRGASTLVAAAALMMLPIASRGLGAFDALPLDFLQVLFTLFLLLSSLSGQTLAAIRAEREAALQRRLALEEQLRHSQKMEAIGRLAGGIAHDFNNLLTAIIGYAEIVMTSFGPGDPRRGDAEEIARAAMRAADLTRQMLAFSRKQVLQRQVIDLNKTLSKVEPMLRRIIDENIVMTITRKATRADVRVDPSQVEQIIMNLVVNARDAMPSGGRLSVETSDARLGETTTGPGPSEYVVLTVSDTGVGMTADVRARIFEPYFTTKGLGKGTGLGLSTAYGIVSQSDGFIDVDSQPGMGTTFRVYLPHARPESSTVAEPAGDRVVGGHEHVLLVEDDASVRRLTRETLIRLGYSVTEAASGRAGISLGSDDTRHFDLAVCDVILGDMSGPAVYEALRALRPSVRALYISGHSDEVIAPTGVLEGGHAFLRKPFTPQELAEKLREVLDAPSP